MFLKKCLNVSIDVMDENQKLKDRIKELEKEVNNLEKDLIHDSLTGLKTRAFFEEETSIYISQIASSEDGKRKNWFGFKNLSILFFDIDYFKKINDTFGHDVGDVALKAVAETINKSVREGDTVARWGGEEIVASLLGASEYDAKRKAEEIRKKIEGLVFEEHVDLKVTISIGVSSYNSGLSFDEVVKNSDKALYEAKNGGRNKVVVFSEINRDS
jgi:diguanylate cyclase (GGDEF)-like protein